MILFRLDAWSIHIARAHPDRLDVSSQARLGRYELRELRAQLPWPVRVRTVMRPVGTAARGGGFTGSFAPVIAALVAGVR